MGREARGKPRAKALGLLSGGLDSTLAAKLLQQQGLDVQGLHFSTGFCKLDHRRALRKPEDVARPARLRNEALRAGADLEAPVDIIDVSEEYLREVVLRPKHGYGAAMNPCIDCRIFMLEKAKQIAEQRGAEVIFTGEVLGQRPMSQYRRALDLIEEEAGLKGRVLRPLSARQLPATRAEQQDRVDRSRLLDIQGRSRRKQLELARRFGIDEFPTPSGGCCYLADRNFSRRLRDLLKHRDPATLQRHDLVFLKVGRHFRLAPDLKLILARDEPESRLLEQRSADTWICHVADRHGAVGRVEGDPEPDRFEPLARLAARYSKHRHRERAYVVFRRAEHWLELRVRPARDESVRDMLL